MIPQKDNIEATSRKGIGIATEVELAINQSRERDNSLRQHIRHLNAELGNYREQIEIQKQKMRLALASYERHQVLKEKNYISAAQLQEKESEILDHRQRNSEVKRLYISAERDLENAKTELVNNRLQRRRDISILTRESLAIDQEITENNARSETLVRAPTAGVITAINAHVGKTAGTNTTLAILIPENAILNAELSLDSRSIGFVKPGMRVALRYQAFPHQKFGHQQATVQEITSTGIGLSESDMPSQISSERNISAPFFRVRLILDKQTITAYGKKVPLKSGMTFDASFMLEKRRLYEWVLDPLLSISGKL